MRMYKATVNGDMVNEEEYILPVYSNFWKTDPKVSKIKVNINLNN